MIVTASQGGNDNGSSASALPTHSRYLDDAVMTHEMHRL